MKRVVYYFHSYIIARSCTKHIDSLQVIKRLFTRTLVMNSDCTVLSPRESGKFIAESTKNVFIEENGIKNIASEILKNLENRELSINNFSQNDHHPNPSDPRAADWIFVLDTLNFSFWRDTNRWQVNGQSGYFALCSALKRALENGIPITDSKYISQITRDELAKILKADEGCGEAPLIDERVNNLREVGRVLLEKYNGTFLECVKSCKNSAEQLLKLIVEDFPCFRDEAHYQNRRVSFYKRAQILVGDIWACYRGTGLGTFHDIHCITMFADYRVPQVLVHFGAMRYTDQLLNRLHSNPHLESGCTEEIEIRGCSIEVVERVVNEVKRLINESSSTNVKTSDVNSILVDHFLWDYRRKHAEELNVIPFHKTRTIFY